MTNKNIFKLEIDNKTKHLEKYIRPQWSWKTYVFIISLISEINEDKSDEFITFKGVAINLLLSQIDTPILFDPKSKPINLEFLLRFNFNSSIVTILYFFY